MMSFYDAYDTINTNTMSESDKRKIKALKMKTVANGATLKEEQSAKRKIEEIKSKYENNSSHMDNTGFESNFSGTKFRHNTYHDFLKEQILYERARVYFENLYYTSKISYEEYLYGINNYMEFYDESINKFVYYNPWNIRNEGIDSNFTCKCGCKSFYIREKDMTINVEIKRKNKLEMNNAYKTALCSKCLSKYKKYKSDIICEDIDIIDLFTYVKRPYKTEFYKTHKKELKEIFKRSTIEQKILWKLFRIRYLIFKK